MDETKTAGASYIISFYQNVQILTHNYSAYLNLLKLIERKYKNIEAAMDDSEKYNIIENVQKVRDVCTKTYIQYLSIIDKLPAIKQDDIKKLYQELIKDFIINQDKLEDFVITMNKILVNEIITDLLESSNNLVGEIYKMNDGKK